MNIKRFDYTKKSGEKDSYEVLVLNEDEGYLKGIALNKLSIDEQTKLVELQQEYEEKLKPFMKSFRQYIKENISYLKG